MPNRQWDIFCTVVDNYGDIGVTWRLARQLVAEHQQTVRLWVDDLAAFARLCPALQIGADQQWQQGVEIRHWSADFDDAWQPGDLVIEAFACTLPHSAIQAMRARRPAPLWLNLEYLSAEPWIDDCHGLPSQEQGLRKFFFFPGFTTRSGGLICEQSLTAERQAWQANPEQRNAWLANLGLPAPAARARIISLFTYESAALPALLETWQQGPDPVLCLIPHGRSLQALTNWPALQHGQPGDHWQAGALQVMILPMTDQPGYDRLLWSCDLNLVRGEDSFLRAQWAAKPFLWHIYPQEAGAHLEKLQAFLDRYCADLPPALAANLQRLNLALNQDDGVAAVAAWQALQADWPLWQQHAQNWPQQVLAGGDLASRLVQFGEKWLK